MTSRYVLLENGEAVPEPDLMMWAVWMETNTLIIRQDAYGKVLISTVFLGVDMRHLGVGPPVLFETMVFGGAHDRTTRRYATRTEAEIGHMETLNLVSKSIDA